MEARTKGSRRSSFTPDDHDDCSSSVFESTIMSDGQEMILGGVCIDR